VISGVRCCGGRSISDLATVAVELFEVDFSMLQPSGFGQLCQPSEKACLAGSCS